MTLAAIEKLNAVVVNGAGGFQIDQVMGVNYTSGIQNYVDPGVDGNIFPRLITSQSTDPGFELRSSELSVLLAELNYTSFPLDGTNTMDVFRALASNLGEGLDSGSVHSKDTISYGLILPSSIKVSNDPPGEMSLMVVPVSSDGATDPVSTTGSVALPTAAAFDESYVVGPLTINGTVCDGIQSYTENFNPTPQKYRADGGLHNVLVNLFNFRPTLTIECIGKEVLDKVASLFSAAYASDTTWFYRHCANDGARTADATESHISNTMTAGKFDVTGYGQTPEGATTYNLEVQIRYDGSNLPVQRGIGVAIE